MTSPGSIASPVTVNAGGTLGGTVTLTSGGTLAPGLSVGTLNTGSVAFSSGAVLAVEIDGTGSDRLNVTGIVSLGGATLSLALLGGFVPPGGTVYTIVANDLSDPVVGTFAGLAEGATLSVGGTSFTISYVGGTGNDVTLTALTPVPFATFTVQKLDITLPPRINDAFALQARFTLGAGSNGIAPLTETVELALTGGTGAFTTTIPAGAFTRNRQGQFTFNCPRVAVELAATITPLGGAVYTVEIAGDQADLTGIANPVTVTLTIGNDRGSTTVPAHIAHGGSAQPPNPLIGLGCLFPHATR